MCILSDLMVIDQRVQDLLLCRLVNLGLLHIGNGLVMDECLRHM